MDTIIDKDKLKWYDYVLAMLFAVLMAVIGDKVWGEETTTVELGTLMFVYLISVRLERKENNNGM